HVQRIMRLVYVTMVDLLGYVGHPHAADLRVLAGAKHGSRIDVGKLRPRLLEADRTGVGDVVAGYVEILAGGTQAAETDIERHECSFAGTAGSYGRWLLADDLYMGKRKAAEPGEIEHQLAA